MDVTKIKGIGKAHAEKLKKVGILMAEELRDIDVEKIGKKSRINIETLRKWKEEAKKMHFLSDLKGIGRTYEQKLIKCGITNVMEMAGADARLLAEKTGISLKWIKKWVDQAKNLVEEKEKKVEIKKFKKARLAEGALENAVVYIKEGTDRAKVRIGEKWHEEIPVIRKEFRSAKEEVERFGYDIAVIAKEGAEKAMIFIDNRWREIPMKEIPKGMVEKLIEKIKGRKKC